MDEETIKKSFSKVKEDVDNLRSEITQINEILRNILDDLTTTKLYNLAVNNDLITTTDNSTVRQINSTNPVTSTDNSTVRQEIGGLKSPNLGISTGNEGASTDRQTDRQTNNSTHFLAQNQEKTVETNIQEASEILDSLDKIKRQVRLKFKRLTNQEMAVFSTIYQLEEQKNLEPNYPNIAKILKLSQSSIRDYVQRMIIKGIPLKKEKINNKKIIISISPELKKLASLSTIIQLRDI
ncbi:MAG: hypothetical protein WC438_01845 [Candidatus Pacearchaeota archaeon]